MKVTISTLLIYSNCNAKCHHNMNPNNLMNNNNNNTNSSTARTQEENQNIQILLTQALQSFQSGDVNDSLTTLLNAVRSLYGEAGVFDCLNVMRMAMGKEPHVNPMRPPPRSASNTNGDGVSFRMTQRQSPIAGMDESLLQALSGLTLHHDPNFGSNLASMLPSIPIEETILGERGDESLLHNALADEETNIVCDKCFALLPRRRYENHRLHWCDGSER